jgi:excisionase family DNA binding protein
MSEIERLLDAKELAKILGVRPAWVYGQAQRGDLPSFRLGHYRKFKLSEIERWLEEQREAAS